MPLERLRAEWRARAAEHGLDRGALARLLGRRRGRPEPSRPQLRRLAAELAGPEGLTREAAAFDRRAILQGWAECHRDGAAVVRLEQLADAFIASADCVELAGPSAATGEGHVPPRYSTPDMLACERRLLELALLRRGEGTGVVSTGAREAAIADRPTLAGEQAELVRSLTGSGDGIELVRAGAGTGKTYALDAAREAWEREGLRVIGAALSARAACELRDCAGIDSVTTAQLLWDLGRGFSLTDRHVVVVDESGMVGTRQLERIAAASAEGGAKLVLVGDDRQLPEIEAGGAFRALADWLGARELTEVRRQRDEWERAALSELRAGRPERWLRESTERGRIWVAKGREEQLGTLVRDWWQARAELGEEQAVMLAYRRRDVAELNGRARAYMRAAGRLDGPELGVGQRGFSAGDRVLCTQNGRRLGVLNGDRGTVTAVDERSRSLRISLDSGKEPKLPPSYLEQGGLDHGYALTVHKSQGMSVERTFVLGSEDLYAELGYTALSRHRDSCRFYINAGDPPRRERLPGLEAQPDPLEPVVRALGESRAKELALEHHECDEELLATPTAELTASSAQLDELLSSYPYLARRATKLAEKEEVAATHARDAAERLAATRRERETLGPLARKGRARLDLQIERQSAVQSRCEAELAKARADRLAADAAGEQWLEQNGAAVAELCASERELTRRREADYDRALQEARIDPPDHVIEHLGSRPEDLAGREAWDEAAAVLLHDEQRFGELPGPDEPTVSGQARAWRSLQSALLPADQRTSPLAPAERAMELDRGGDLDLGP